MIKPIELFPGALIQSKAKRPGIMEVLAVGKEKIVATSKYFYEEEYFLEEIRPIPVKPEIVKKLGFKRERSSTHMYEYYRRGDVEIWFCNKKLTGVWWKGCQRHVKKSYVHQLQRLIIEQTKARIDFSKLLK